MRLAVLFHRLGPYHIARLSELAARVDELVAIEMTARDNVYRWVTTDSPSDFKRMTVMVDVDVDAVSLNCYRDRLESYLAKANADAVLIPG